MMRTRLNVYASQKELTLLVHLSVSSARLTGDVRLISGQTLKKPLTLKSFSHKLGTLSTFSFLFQQLIFQQVPLRCFCQTYHSYFLITLTAVVLTNSISFLCTTPTTSFQKKTHPFFGTGGYYETPCTHLS